MPKQDGGRALRSHKETCRGIEHVRPRQISGKVGIVGDPPPKLNNCEFLNSEMLFFSIFRLPESEFSGDRYTCRTPHCRMYRHSTDHTAQMTCLLWLKFELRPQKRSVIHASCFTLRLTEHGTPAQVLFHLPLLCYCRPLLRTQTCCPRIH